MIEENILTELQFKTDIEKFKFLLDKVEQIKLQNNKDLTEMKNEISVLKDKILNLEISNKKLVQEKNERLVLEHADEIINSINEKCLSKFKTIINRTGFPVDEYLYETAVRKIFLNFFYSLNYLKNILKIFLHKIACEI
jgi:glutathionyl-hydroquinone reductase